MWILYAFLSALFAGVTSILAKIGIRDMDSNLATALRTVVVAAFAWLMVPLTGSSQAVAGIDSRSLLFLVLSGLATGASWLCYFRALQTGDVNKVVPIDKSSTVITMLLAIVLLGEPFTALGAVSMVLILAGTILMLERKRQQEPPAAKGRSWLLYAVASAVFASLTAILGKVGIENVDSNLGTAIRTLVVLAMAWLIVFVSGKHRELRRVPRKAWPFLALSGASTGLSWLCYYRALQEGPASVVVPIDKLSILVTVAFAFFVFGERLSRRSAAGLAAIVSGTLLLLV